MGDKRKQKLVVRQYAGVPLLVVTDEMVAAWARTYAEGQTCNEIADVVGIGSTLIARYMRELGYPMRAAGGRPGVPHKRNRRVST